MIAHDWEMKYIKNINSKEFLSSANEVSTGPTCQSVCVPCALLGFPVFFSRLSLSKRPSSYCLIHFVGSSGAAWRQKTTFNGRRPSMEDDLRWKTTFDGRRPSMEDDLPWKMTDGRMWGGGGCLWVKFPFKRRRPLMED